jgi:hypothetical protein
MRTRKVASGILMVAFLSLAFAYIYHLGYSRGSADERLHWLVRYKDGVWTAHENPAHPIFGPVTVRSRPGMNPVNSIPMTAAPK